MYRICNGTTDDSSTRPTVPMTLRQFKIELLVLAL